MSDMENTPVPGPGSDVGTEVGGDVVRSDLDLLTVAEVAALLRLSKMTIYRLMDKGKLPALRVGRSFRIPRESVQALLDESTNRG